MSATKLSTANGAEGIFDAGFSPLMNLDGVMIERGGRILFRNASFSLQHGGIVHVAGVNGSGKTSLLRALAGALPVSAGHIAIAPDTTFAFLPADDALWCGQMTLRTALNDWAAVLGVDAARVDDVLVQLELDGIAARAVALLSMGQKRRLSWARMLLRPSTVWLLDEPFNSLDSAGVARVAAVMNAHVVAGGAMIVACHDDIAALLPNVDITHVVVQDGGA